MLWRRSRNEEEATQRLSVGGLELAYTDVGAGRPVVFLHGGVGSTYLWRGVIPHLAEDARCIAVDVAGTGQSDRVPHATSSSYSWPLHVGYLEGFLDRLGVGNQMTLVMHGWGSIIGLSWAAHHSSRLAGLAYMEAVTRPLAWHEIPESCREIVKRARSDEGEHYVMERDDFFDEWMRDQVLSPLPPEAVEAYRRAFGSQGDARRAVHTALNELPLGGRPRQSAQLLRRVSDWLKEVEIPKLLILGRPGYLVTEFGRNAAKNIANQSMVHVSGRHLLPEESPELVAMFLRLWWRGLQ